MREVIASKFFWSQLVARITALLFSLHMVIMFVLVRKMSKGKKLLREWSTEKQKVSTVVTVASETINRPGVEVVERDQAVVPKLHIITCSSL